MRLSTRLKLLEERKGQTRLAWPLYQCIVDGEPRTMRMLDAVYEKYMEGRSVEIGQQCGVEYEPAPTAAQQRKMREELDRWMKEYCDEYNSPEAIAKRKAEYEELQRKGARNYAGMAD